MRNPFGKTSLIAAFLVPALAGCASSAARGEARTISRELREEAPPLPPAERADDELDEALATEPRLDDVLRVALARNPELRRARADVGARLSRMPAAAGLPDPELTYELRQVPLNDPLAFDMAEEHMFTLGQTLPAPGSLHARGKQAAADARIAGETLRAAERDVAARVTAAWAELYEASHEVAIRERHLALANDVTTLARARYQSGRAAQGDALRAAVAAASAQNDLVVARARVARSRALLNSLLDRAPTAPLGTPPPPDAAALQAPAELAARAEAEAPAVRSAAHAVERAEAGLDGARSEARWPSFMLGATYSNMPMAEEQHAWGAMVGITLPWFNDRHGAEVEAAEGDLAASRRALEAARNDVRFGVADASARLEAARGSLAILQNELNPSAERSFESARAAYAGGSGDALGLLDSLRSLLEVRLETVRAGARVATAVAELSRAAGRLPDLSSPAGEHTNEGGTR